MGGGRGLAGSGRTVPPGLPGRRLRWAAYQFRFALKQMSELSAGSGLRAHEAPTARSLEEVQTEYTRLFISAYPALLCPPYESYYREGLVYGQTSIDAEEWYRQYHLQFSGENEPPDHLSVELEFLAITGDSAFGQKLREWVPKFTERVKASSTIYGACTEDLERFLNKEQLHHAPQIDS
jgi:TorA maturation chaperone TorD